MEELQGEIANKVKEVVDQGIAKLKSLKDHKVDMDEETDFTTEDQPQASEQSDVKYPEISQFEEIKVAL